MKETESGLLVPASPEPEAEADEFPAYDSCRERGEGGCAQLKLVRTQLGKAYACPVCQMTYVQMDKGAFIPYDQAMELAVKRARQQQQREARRTEFQAKARKKRKRRK